MTHRSGGTGWTGLIFLAVVFVAVGVLLVRREIAQHAQVPAKPVIPTTTPATAPTSAPAATQKAKPADYMDVVRRHYPEFATTQPFTVPVAMNEGARLIINDPIYVDVQGELWIARADAESTVSVLKAADERSTHVLKEQVVYVQRWPDETGVWQPQLFCRKPEGGYEIVTQTSRTDISQTLNYDWNRAFSWNNVVVVPTDRGVMLIRPDRRPMEVYHELVPADQFVAGKYSQPQALIDWRGLIAWMPFENDKLGSTGAARFVNDKWMRLDASVGWPEKILHLVPLLDGSILQLVVNDDKSVQVNVMTQDAAEIDENKVGQLVEQLSDPDVDKRNEAFAELTRWGPGLWPVLDKLRGDQPPEAQVRLSQLLASKIQPNMGGMLLQPGPIRVLARSSFGGAMLYTEAGVRLQVEGDDDPPLVAPAWISLVPGRAIGLAPPGLVEQLKPKGRQLSIIRSELIVIDDVEGPRWWLSNHLGGPLLKPKELEFKELLGQDQRGRWFFRRSLDEPAPTLVIDPTLPDPTPHFPVWVYKVDQGQAGWTAEDWPAIKKGGAWALVNTEWKPIDETKEKFLTAPEPNPPPEPPPVPATTPATGPTSTESLGPPILVEPDGNRFYDGHQTLHMIGADDKHVIWNLPPEAVGRGDVHLFRAGENRLFLFNSPGRALRIRQTPDQAEPFKLEATFTKRIPNSDHPDRVWLDPAGRIVIITDADTLSICFPSGRIPPEIAKKMTANDLREAQE